MKKQWIAFILTAIGAVVVGLWIYRKVNPGTFSLDFVNSLPTVPSGGAGVQSATQEGYKLTDPISTISIGPSSVTPAPKVQWDPNFVDSLPVG